MIQRRKFLKNLILMAPVLIVPKLSLSKIDQGLSNVLIIGDSISIGFTPFVQELLKYSAKVVRPLKENGEAENCQGTTNGVLHITRWIGNT